MTDNNDTNILLDWLQLIRSFNVGASTFIALIDVYKTADRACLALSDIAKKNSRSKIKLCSREEVEIEMESTLNLGAKMIPSYDENYPKMLLNIKDYPPIIITHGDTSLLNERSIAIVGSRDASLNGKKLTRDIAVDLGKAGFVVTSGLASGIRHFSTSWLP